jgi:4-oxalocrotonate tautomerase
LERWANPGSAGHAWKESDMPLIEIKFFEEEFSDEERKGIIGAVTDAMVGFTGEQVRPYTWVVLQEVKSGGWGIGGTALGLPDVRALQAQSD